MLQKQTITIPLGLGINTKTDEKLVEQGSFNLVAENASFEKTGAVKKREAYKSLPDTYHSSTTDGQYPLLDEPPVSLATIGGVTLLRCQNGDYLYSHADSFVLKDENPVPECKLSIERIYSGPGAINQTDTDYDPYEKIIIAAAREGNTNGNLTASLDNGSVFFLYDYEKGSLVATPKVPSGGMAAGFGFVRAGFTRVDGQSYYYHISVDTTGTLKILTYNKFGQEIAAPYTVSGMAQGSFGFLMGSIAVCRSDDDSEFYIVAAKSGTGGESKFLAISADSVVVDQDITIENTYFESASAKFDNGKINVLLSGGNLAIFNPDGTQDGSLVSISTGFGYGAISQDHIDKYIGYGSSTVRKYENSNSFDLSSLALLMSDVLKVGDLEVFVVASRYFESSSSYMVLFDKENTGGASTRVVARFSKDRALINDDSMSVFAIRQPARMAKISPSEAVVALPVLNNRTTDNYFYDLQLTFIEIDTEAVTNGRATIGENIFFQGGFLSEFDGSTLMENGFHIPPVKPTLAEDGAGILTGTFNYVTVFKYIDSKGQVTRSAPSLASPITVTSKKVKVTVPAMPFGVKAKKCIVEVYRTENNGAVFHYIGEKMVDMTTATTFDIISDDISDISGNRFLYTEGGILANDPGPGGDFVFQGGNRLYIGGLEDKNEIAYSKKKIFGEVVNFSDFFRIRIDTAQYNISGGITAGGYMDGKIILFKENSIFYMAGDGPLETGLDDTFTTPELISADSGCTQPRSVVLTPLGIMYKSTKGFYLLDRGLVTSFIGAPVDAFNDYKVTSAVLVSDKNQVVFTLKSSDVENKYMLVFDYHSQQWSVVTGIRAIDGDLLDGYHLVLDGDLFTPRVQDGIDYKDDDSVYSMRVKTPWVKVTGIQDFARIWRILILGKYKSAHTLTVKVRYDYDENYVETYNILPSLLDEQYQYECHLKKQKCQAIQVEIYDENQVGESMELTALTFEVGVRKGGMKLAPSRKY